MLRSLICRWLIDEDLILALSIVDLESSVVDFGMNNEVMVKVNLLTQIVDLGC